MKGDSKEVRERQVAIITGSLKAIAKEFEVPIFALCQLNRNSDNRTGDSKKPQLSDLRESGAIEQDADIVTFPYRLDYYFKDDPSLKGEGLVIVAKNRGGETGEAQLKIDLAHHIWADALDYQEEEMPLPQIVENKDSDSPYNFDNEVPF